MDKFFPNSKDPRIDIGWTWIQQKHQILTFEMVAWHELKNTENYLVRKLQCEKCTYHLHYVVIGNSAPKSMRILSL